MSTNFKIGGNWHFLLKMTENDSESLKLRQISPSVKMCSFLSPTQFLEVNCQYLSLGDQSRWPSISSSTQSGGLHGPLDSHGEPNTPHPTHWVTQTFNLCLNGCTKPTRKNWFRYCHIISRLISWCCFLHSCLSGRHCLAIFPTKHWLVHNKKECVGHHTCQQLEESRRCLMICSTRAPVVYTFGHDTWRCFRWHIKDKSNRCVGLISAEVQQDKQRLPPNCTCRRTVCYDIKVKEVNWVEALSRTGEVPNGACGF